MEQYDIENNIILKLKNFIKGQAQSIRDANEKMYSPERRLEEMKVIEEFLKYIKGYKRNQILLSKTDMDLEI